MLFTNLKDKIMNPRYYSITAYGAPGQPFPKFHDSYLTLVQARTAALNHIKDGYRYVKVQRDDIKPTGFFGVSRMLIEEHGVV